MSRRILLVDDEPMFLQVVSRFLRDEGHLVRTADGGAQAKEILTDKRFELDCLITDMRMPHLSGLDLFEWVAAQTPEIPVILITGYADLDNSTLKTLGVRAILNKPIQLQDLLDVLASL